MDRKTPLIVLFSYSSVAAPLAALYFPVYIFLADFYVRNFDVKLVEIGLIFLCVRLFDAVSDPIMGLVSDRFKTPLGFRRFWLVLGTPLVFVSTIALFWPNPEAIIGSFYLTIWLVLLTVGWTVMMTPYFALGAEMSSNYSERSRITLYREAIALVGTILAAILYSLGKNDLEGMKYIALFVVIILPLSVLSCVYFVSEDVKPKVVPKRLDLLKIFSAFRSEPMFIRLLVAYFVNGAANALPAALFVFFVGQRLGAPHLAGPFLLIYFGAAVIATPLWVKLSERIEKHRLWCYAMIYASGVFFSVVFIGSGDLLAFFVVCLLSGFALSADLAIPSSIQADLIDIETVKGGKRRTGAFFSFWSIATKSSVAVSSGLALLILSYFDFDIVGNNSKISLGVLTGLYAIAPIILKIFSIFLMWNFKLNKKYQKELRKSLIQNT